MKITMRDVRAAKGCSRGVREFFKRHNLDYSKFLREGVDVKIIENINDAMGNQVVEVARGRK